MFYTGKLKDCCCCFCSVAKLCLALCNPMDCSTPDSSVLHCLQSLLKYMSIESLMLYNHLISATLFYFCLQSFRWPKYWSLSISISSSSEYSGFISFRLTGLNSLQSRNSQESSLGPQLESISSSVLSLLYSPTLTSVHDY